VVASLVIGGVLLLAMIAASGWAAVTLPPDARIPIHFGSDKHCYWVPKRVGLVAWPAAGVLVYGILGGLSASSMASNWVPGVRDVLMPAVMCVVFGFQTGALVLARQHRARRTRVSRRAGTRAARRTTARSEKSVLKGLTMASAGGSEPATSRARSARVWGIALV
jgi:hypothetical protein